MTYVQYTPKCCKNAYQPHSNNIHQLYNILFISYHTVFSLQAITPCSLDKLSLRLLSLGYHTLFSLYSVTTCSLYRLSLRILSTRYHSVFSLQAIALCSLYNL